VNAAVAPVPSGPFSRGSICYKPYVCDGEAAERIDDLLAQATAAERAGFDGITISEHHLGFPGYLPNPLQVASWVLERTSHVWVAPAPALVLLRPVNLVAEELAWLAARYPGRVGAGFAAGSIAADFELAGTDQRDLTERFEVALRSASRLLGGDVPPALMADPALARLVEHPLPVISAASSFTACRRAARSGCGILLESSVAPDELAKMVRAYRAAGGAGAVVVVRRAWIGDDPPVELERRRDELVRSTVPDYNRGAWLAPDRMIVCGDGETVADSLAGVVRHLDADVLNLRVHVPGLAPSVVVEQIELLGAALPRLRRSLSTTPGADEDG
jgi:alkanesulfonate monooxygenase SsuD/methylene tetrahydromethanopterin reductase-like flavin-dependent oxidoreductase (luciferase family)